jgi:septin family protein
VIGEEGMSMMIVGDNYSGKKRMVNQLYKSRLVKMREDKECTNHLLFHYKTVLLNQEWYARKRQKD